MPYTRPIRRFYLTPPSFPIFLVSVILAVLAVLATYGKMSIFNASYAFLVLLIAYLVLLAGTLFRRRLSARSRIRSGIGRARRSLQ